MTQQNHCVSAVYQWALAYQHFQWVHIGMALPWYGVMVACPSECIALPGREEVAPACAPISLHALKFGQIWGFTFYISNLRLAFLILWKSFFACLFWSSSVIRVLQLMLSMSGFGTHTSGDNSKCPKFQQFQQKSNSESENIWKQIELQTCCTAYHLYIYATNNRQQPVCNIPLVWNKKGHTVLPPMSWVFTSE